MAIYIFGTLTQVSLYIRQPLCHFVLLSNILCLYLLTSTLTIINYRCKTFIMQLIQFPSTLLLWPKLGRVIDERNNENTSSQFTFMQVLEAMVNIELPNIKYGLKVIELFITFKKFNHLKENHVIF